MNVKRTAAVVAVAGALGAGAAVISIAQSPTSPPGPPSCCAERARQDSKAHESGNQGRGTMQCSLTGTVIEVCCCEARENGKSHCTLAEKDVDGCCCQVVDEGSVSRRPLRSKCPSAARTSASSAPRPRRPIPTQPTTT